MRAGFKTTVVCPRCDGKGWWYKIIKRPFLKNGDLIKTRQCMKCHGIGLIRQDRQIFYTKKPHLLDINRTVKNSTSRVQRFKEKNPERWKEIQDKYRKSEEAKERNRTYMKEYRIAQKTGEKKEKSLNLFYLCIICKQNKRVPRRVMCKNCLKKDILKRLTAKKLKPKTDSKKIVEMRESNPPTTFAQIAKKFNLTRQGAHYAYYAAKKKGY